MRKAVDLFDFFGMGVHIKFLLRKTLAQAHNGIQVFGIEPETGIQAGLLRARFARPALAGVEFRHGTPITIVLRCFQQGQWNEGHILLLRGQRKHGHNVQGDAHALQLP